MSAWFWQYILVIFAQPPAKATFYRKRNGQVQNYIGFNLHFNRFHLLNTFNMFPHYVIHVMTFFSAQGQLQTGGQPPSEGVHWGFPELSIVLYSDILPRYYSKNDKTLYFSQLWPSLYGIAWPLKFIQALTQLVSHKTIKLLLFEGGEIKSYHFE